MHTEIKSIQDEMKSQLDGLKNIKTSYDDTKENSTQEMRRGSLGENVEGKCSTTFTAISQVLQGLRMQIIPLWKGIFIILTLV